MLAQTRLKLRNAESSIAFMQEQHARTLEGLHHEIQKLQKKNTRLAFELAMKGPSTVSSVSTSCSYCKELGEELTSCKAEILGLRSALSTHKETIKLLEHQVGELQSRNDKAAVSNDAKMTGMAIELESKSNIIALLTQQLHQSRVLLQQAVEHSSPSTSTPSIVRRPRKPRRSTSSPSSSSLSLMEERACLSPRPPSTSPSCSSIRRASNTVRRESASLPSSTDSQYQYVRVSRSQQVSRHSSRVLDPVRSHREADIPQEISEILQFQSQELSDDGTVMAMKPTLPVLPPIGAETNISQQQLLSSASLPLPVPNGLDSPDFNTARQRHIILAKAQQRLSSAQSAVRALQQQQQQQQRAGVAAEEVGSERDAADETTAKEGLLVRQSVNKKTQAWQELHQKGAD